MNTRSILLASIVGALSVTAPAMAQDCAFIPGNKVLQEQGASDARIMSFLNDMGPARSEQRTDVKHFAARIAATMATKPELYKAITPSCFTPDRLADGFLKVNGLSGTLTDSQFAARVRSTGFTLPTMAVAPAPAPAQPAPAPAAAAAQPAPVNTAVTDALRSNIGELERKLAALQARPAVTLTPAERQQLANLPGQIQQAVDARAGSETHANAAAASATTAETHAGTAARASASALGSKEAASASALAAASSATASAASATEARKNEWAVWTALGLAIASILGFGWNFFMKAGRGQVKALHASVSDMKEMVGDIRLPKGWYDELNKAPLNDDLAVNVMVGDGHGPLTPRFVIRLYKAEEGSVVITSGINGRAGDSIKIAGLEILVRQSGFRSQLTETVAPVSEVAA